MQRRRQRRAREPRPPPCGIDQGHIELRLQAHVVDRADLAEEREGVGVTAEQDVLAVVDLLAGLAIGERRGPAAEPRARLEHEDARSTAGQPDGRGQPRKPRTNDNDVWAGHAGHSHCLSAIIACLGRATRVRAVKTSKPLLSIRRSVSKYTARMISDATSRLQSSGGRAA